MRRVPRAIVFKSSLTSPIIYLLFDGALLLLHFPEALLLRTHPETLRVLMVCQQDNLVGDYYYHNFYR